MSGICFLCARTCPARVCPHICTVCVCVPPTNGMDAMNANMCTRRTCVVTATRTDVNKRGSRVTIFSLSSSRVQFISMQPRKAAIYMKREPFLGNRGLSEGFDVGSLLLAREWKPKPSREGEGGRGASCGPTKRAQFPHVVAALPPESPSPFPLNTLGEGQA